jgi:hypothetical protein
MGDRELLCSSHTPVLIANWVRSGTGGPSPQGVLHFRTGGTCSSERRFGRILHPEHPKVKREVSSVLKWNEPLGRVNPTGT